MPASSEDGTMRHLTSHDPECNVPRLLERVRAAILERGDIEVYDITFKPHFDGPDYVAEMSVYYGEAIRHS